MNNEKSVLVPVNDFSIALDSIDGVCAVCDLLTQVQWKNFINSINLAAILDCSDF